MSRRVKKKKKKKKKIIIIIKGNSLKVEFIPIII